MIDTKAIQARVDWYEENYKKDCNFVNFPWFEEYLYQPILNALGDDENEIREYISTADFITLGHLTSVFEELYDKFPSVEMEDFLDKVYNDYEKERRKRAKMRSDDE